MIAKDELFMIFMEGDGFRNFMNVACPHFKMSSRWIVTRDIFNILVKERLNLIFFFQNKLSKSLSYNRYINFNLNDQLCITAHLIDTEWKLHKKIIAFVC